MLQQQQHSHAEIDLIELITYVRGIVSSPFILHHCVQCGASESVHNIIFTCKHSAPTYLICCCQDLLLCWISRLMTVRVYLCVFLELNPNRLGRLVEVHVSVTLICSAEATQP